ncbi:MAG TPA: hypothetical protein VJP85_12840, partial [Candidatus Baltobacteraceae bacterium]|nr:hypothetical protein [Candidatus Baltobacteraceae bacterium]
MLCASPSLGPPFDKLRMTREGVRFQYGDASQIHIEAIVQDLAQTPHLVILSLSKDAPSPVEASVREGDGGLAFARPALRQAQ